LPDPQTLADKLGLWGVDETKQVVVYDDSFGSIAGRLWWLLRWLEHEAVALLDGGLQRWQREGFPMTAERPRVHPAVFTPRPNDALWVNERQVQEWLHRPALGGLVDARSPERFNGEREPIDPVAGHIPGAVNHPYEDNLDFSGNFLSPEELRKLYRKILEGTPPEESIQMCGSGITACHNLLAMEIAGLSGARLFPGSWSAWITDPSRPVATRTRSP
jgi:thiosulfate/3-mercaptopyruvate sulfurtransferase